MKRTGSHSSVFAAQARPRVEFLLMEALRDPRADASPLYDGLRLFIERAKAEGVDAPRVIMALDDMIDAAAADARYREYRALKDRVVRWGIDEYYGMHPHPVVDARH